MPKLKTILSGALAIVAIVTVGLDGGIELLPVQVLAMGAFVVALALGGAFQEEYRNGR